MKVSIIIPVYNVTDYVERCIRSVMAQSYTDIECILVDDCTPDDSIEKCERMIDKYNGPIKFKILHHEHNRGLSAARNTGTDAATGEYIFYLDSDDEIIPDCINLMMAEMERHPDTEMVSAAITSIPHNDYYDIPYYKEYHHVDGNLALRTLFFGYKCSIQTTAWNKLVRSSFLKKYNLYFVEGILSEDEVWTFALMQHCKSLTILPERTYIHYDTVGSIMNSFNYNSRCDTLTIVLQNNVRQIERPLARLQIYRCLQHLFSAYPGVQRKSYASISRHLSWLLALNWRPILALQTYIYFRFGFLRNIFHNKEKFCSHIDRAYRLESKQITLHHAIKKLLTKCHATIL